MRIQWRKHMQNIFENVYFAVLMIPQGGLISLLSPRNEQHALGLCVSRGANMCKMHWEIDIFVVCMIPRVVSLLSCRPEMAKGHAKILPDASGFHMRWEGGWEWFILLAVWVI